MCNVMYKQLYYIFPCWELKIEGTGCIVFCSNIGCLCTSKFFSLFAENVTIYFFLKFNFTFMKKRSLHFLFLAEVLQSKKREFDCILNLPIVSVTRKIWSCIVQCMYAESLLCSLRIVSLCIIEAWWKSSSALESTLSAWDFIWNWNTANFK